MIFILSSYNRNCYSNNVSSTLKLIIIGVLDTAEALNALSELVDDEVTHEQIATVLDEFDKDGNGEIDMSEFAVMVVRSLKVLYLKIEFGYIKHSLLFSPMFYTQ